MMLSTIFLALQYTNDKFYPLDWHLQKNTHNLIYISDRWQKIDTHTIEYMQPQDKISNLHRAEKTLLRLAKTHTSYTHVRLFCLFIRVFLLP